METEVIEIGRGYGSHSFLNKYIGEDDARKIMEIGVSGGGNARNMLRVAMEKHSPDSVEYCDFDKLGGWKDHQLKRIKNKLSKLGCKFKLIKGNRPRLFPITSITFQNGPNLHRWEPQL